MRITGLILAISALIAPAWGEGMIERVQRGDALIAQGRPKLALAEYEKALAMGAGSAIFLNRLASLYMQNGAFAKAAESLHKSLGEDPKQLPVYSALGEAFLAMGKLDSAIFYVEQARILAPASSSVYSSLGFLYLQAGRAERARDQLEKALDLDIKNPEAHRLFGFYYSQQDSVDKAIASYQRLSELLPDEVEAYNNIAFLHASAQRYPRALKFYKLARSRSRDPYLTQAIQRNLEAGRGIMDGKMRARYILVKTQAKANDVLERLAKGANFAQLAQEISIAPNAQEGGDLGFFAPGELMAEFEEAVLKLEVGQLSQVVEVPMGFIVVQRLN